MKYFLDEETPLNHNRSGDVLLSLFRWTYLREDFKEVLADLFCIIAVGLADEPDGIRRQDVAGFFGMTGMPSVCGESPQGA